MACSGTALLYYYYYYYYYITAAAAAVLQRLHPKYATQVVRKAEVSCACRWGETYESEIRPTKDLLSIPQVIYGHCEPRRNDIEREIPDSSTRDLWQSYQQSSSSKAEETGEGNDTFGLTKYLCSYIERFFDMP
jgi:hypothetical protein